MDSDTLRWILLACFVLGCIFFLVITILGYKSWRVLHILAAIFLFACAATFAVYFALLSKATLAWKQIDRTNRVAAEDAESKLNDFVYGEIGPAFTEESVIGIHNALARELIGRGRVWRSATGQFQGNSVAVTLGQPPIVEGGEAPPVPTIDAGSPIFVFTEQVSPEANGMAAPQRYLGEFNVSNANGSSITLVPTLTFYQPNEFPGAVQLVLFEKMPGDRNNLLADLRAQYPDPVEFRNFLTSQVFPPQFFGLLPEHVTPGSSTMIESVAKSYERLIDEYQFDGLTKSEIDVQVNLMKAQMPRISAEFIIKPEDLWVTVTMEKDYTVQVDAENPGGADDIRRLAVSRTYYDTRGLAISADLRLEREVELKAGDVIEIDNVTAMVGYPAAEEGGAPYLSWEEQGLISNASREVYRRPMVDYQLALQELNLAQTRIAAEIIRVQGIVETMESFQDTLERQLEIEGNKNQRLQFDLDSLLEDVRVVTAYENELKSLLSARRERINALFLETQALANRKTELELEMVRRIDQATAEAVSAQ